MLLAVLPRLNELSIGRQLSNVVAEFKARTGMVLRHECLGRVGACFVLPFFLFCVSSRLSRAVCHTQWSP